MIMIRKIHSVMDNYVASSQDYYHYYYYFYYLHCVHLFISIFFGVRTSFQSFLKSASCNRSVGQGAGQPVCLSAIDQIFNTNLPEFLHFSQERFPHVNNSVFYYQGIVTLVNVYVDLVVFTRIAGTS